MEVERFPGVIPSDAIFYTSLVLRHGGSGYYWRSLENRPFEKFLVNHGKPNIIFWAVQGAVIFYDPFGIHTTVKAGTASYSYTTSYFGGTARP